VSSIFEFIFRLETLWYVIVLFYVLACLALIGIVLIQKGKGVGFAGAFGLGAGTETVFGARGTRSIPVRLTYGLATAFMVFALLLSLMTGKVGKGAAPETVEAGTLMDESGKTGLEDLNIGSAVEGEGASAAGSDTGAPAPIQLETPTLDGAAAPAPAEDSAAAPAPETAPAEGEAVTAPAPVEGEAAAPVTEVAPEGEAAAPTEETAPAAEEPAPEAAAPAEEAAPAEGETPAPESGQ
jgi:protein translocase SecG subunit